MNLSQQPSASRRSASPGARPSSRRRAPPPGHTRASPVPPLRPGHRRRSQVAGAHRDIAAAHVAADRQRSTTPRQLPRGTRRESTCRYERASARYRRERAAAARVAEPARGSTPSRPSHGRPSPLGASATVSASLVGTSRSTRAGSRGRRCRRTRPKPPRSDHQLVVDEHLPSDATTVPGGVEPPLAAAASVRAPSARRHHVRVRSPRPRIDDAFGMTTCANRPPRHDRDQQRRASESTRNLDRRHSHHHMVDGRLDEGTASSRQAAHHGADSQKFTVASSPCTVERTMIGTSQTSMPSEPSSR